MIEHVQGECKDQRGNTIEFDLHYEFTKKEIVAHKKIVRNRNIRILPNDSIVSDIKECIHKKWNCPSN